MTKFWNTRVASLQPYVPGEQPSARKYIKLNTNENPYPPSARAVAAMKQAASNDVRLYPDPEARELKQAIADYYQADVDNVFVGNGSDEVLAHAFAAFFEPGEALVMPDISYSFYPAYQRLFALDAVLVPLREDYSFDLEDVPVDNGGVIFANPNAPTGRSVSVPDIEALLNRCTQKIVIVDEAYVDFGASTAVSLVAKYPNLLVVQTLSKSRSLAGLRVGFAIGDAFLIEALERVKNSFNSYPLSRIAQAGAIAAIEDVEWFQKTCNQVQLTRNMTRQILLEMNFEVLPSHTNFVFAKPPVGFTAQGIYEGLKEAGILVRYFDKDRLSEYLRISIGSDGEMLALFGGLKKLLS